MSGDIERIGEYAHWVILNANDVFGLACADAVTIEPEGLPLLFDMVDRFGSEGYLAFLAQTDGKGE